MISPLIETRDLLYSISNKDIVIIDASGGPKAKENYESLHLDGALFVDLEKDLAKIEENLGQGGRHPLPHPAEFGKTLGKLGITPSTHVVIYDDKNGANAAARFWWMLKAAGHEKVQVINGGLNVAVKEGFPANSNRVTPKASARYSFRNWNLPTKNMVETGKFAQNKNNMVIDVREKGRFDGEFEPIDLIAGHIPGAINIPYANNLGNEGKFLSTEELYESYARLFGNIASENIIFHCGSGVTACHSLLAVTYAGFEMPNLYVGSWSEWSRNNNPIAKK